MTQPTALQADVQLRTLRANEAREAISNPVDIRRGEVRTITLTIPLLTDRNSYLVVRLPDQAVQDLLSHVRTLPTNERNNFIREWVMRNQQAVIEQHVRIGGRERRFRYDVVPVQAQPRVSESTPRRVEPQPPVSATVPRREPPAQVPPQAAPQSRVIQPGGAPPAQPARREAPAQPAPAPVVVQPPAVGTARPIERPVPAPAPVRRELPPFPAQIRGGNGSSRTPYRVYKSAAEVEQARRRSGQDIADSTIEAPITLSIEGLGDIRFTVAFTARQLTNSARGRTSTELWGIMRQTAERVAAERGVRMEPATLRDAQRAFNRGFASIIQRTESSDENLAAYLRSH
ncbi:MAG: hypothetical protein V1861_04895 [Candidatus Micrarchaeota archaeon]